MTCTYQHNQQWLSLHVISHGCYFDYCNTHFIKYTVKVGMGHITGLIA